MSSTPSSRTSARTTRRRAPEACGAPPRLAETAGPCGRPIGGRRQAPLMRAARRKPGFSSSVGGSGGLGTTKVSDHVVAGLGERCSLELRKLGARSRVLSVGGGKRSAGTEAHHGCAIPECAHIDLMSPNAGDVPEIVRREGKIRRLSRRSPPAAARLRSAPSRRSAGLSFRARDVACALPVAAEAMRLGRWDPRNVEISAERL
jgi:hypothetical protein